MKRIKLVFILIFLIVSCLPIFNSQKVLALEFYANDIISNSDMQDYESMSLEGIIEFLDSHNGVLKNYRIKDYFGVEKSAAEIIYNAAQAYKINPKWILATLQKEQSLITNPSPSQYNLDWAMGYAVCDSCSVDDPRVQLFKGFGTQVDRATWRIRYYYENPEKFNFRVGKLSLVDNRDVLPYNQATANLYNYTPHIHGNYNFWLIWNRWFSKIYPDGTLVKKEGDTGVWLIEDGKRRPFWSKAALISRYDESRVIKISRNDLLRYEVGYPIKYPNYSLLSSLDGKIYLTVNNEKKQIESPEVFRMIGFNPEEVIEVTEDELAYYQEGRKITLNSLYPQGALLQDNKSGGVYYVEDGIKYSIWDKEIMQVNYPDYKLTPVSSEELNKYVTAATGVRFKDGSLIKLVDNSKVYVISNGQRRWIANETTFNQLSYKWSDVIVVSEKVASLHPMGQQLDLDFSNDSRMATNLNN
ncbi:MAG: hypothetical protein GF365_04265 [Candidatus Buchananbacteria bacterium]|nr:hypothetical protein [Candidatus Buchananbacteria bacterium]